MDRVQKLKLNSVSSLINRLVIIISGLILPRLLLLNFGSETNGLVASVNQFLSIIMFLDLGVGSVVQSALYRPIAEKDDYKISLVLASAREYFRKIAIFLLLYVVILIVFYPLLIDSNFSYLSTVFLILALSISLFGQYYFGIVNELLLNSNQQSYIQFGTEIVVVLLNLLVSIILIRSGASIQIVKLGSGIIFLLRPLFLRHYVNKNFNIDYNVVVKEESLPQKWNGMGQHIAYSIQSSANIVLLTIFSTLENISIYNVYNIVVQAIQILIQSLITGIGSFFGNLLANDEIELLNNYFDRIEWIAHTSVVFLYGMTAMLINSFVMFYTSGVEDINYNVPMFSIILVLARATNSLRTPYQTMIFSAGHFKQTQNSSIIEASLNIIISLFAVKKFGLTGVAIGTLVSVVYRIAYLVRYLSLNIIFRPYSFFLKHLFVDIISFVTIVGVSNIVKNMYSINSINDWLIASTIIGIISLILLLLINFVFFKQLTQDILKKLLIKFN